MDEQDILHQLLQLTSRLSTQVEMLTNRLDKFEQCITNDALQDQKLQHIEEELQEERNEVLSLERRIGTLESAEGDRAKAYLKAVAGHLTSAGVGFILSAIGYYLANKAG